MSTAAGEEGREPRGQDTEGEETLTFEHPEEVEARWNVPGEHPIGERTRTGEPREYRWVYLWHWPIRTMHWVAALCVVVLAVTGFFIGKPYFMTTGEPSSHYLMGWMRFLHFTAAGVLVATAIVRAYWLLAGNRFERLRALFPVRKRDWVNMGRMIKYYLMIRPKEAPHYLGHNPFQQIWYTGIYALALVMTVTGFAMYGQANPGGFFFNSFDWVNSWLGNVQVTRFVHHVLAWAFVIFFPVHIYLALRADLVERTGTISSMISGGRFVPTDREYVDE